MEIERHDGTREKRWFTSEDELTADLRKLLDDPTVKKVTVYPRLRIPRKRTKSGR